MSLDLGTLLNYKLAKERAEKTDQIDLMGLLSSGGGQNPAQSQAMEKVRLAVQVAGRNSDDLSPLGQTRTEGTVLTIKNDPGWQKVFQAAGVPMNILDQVKIDQQKRAQMMEQEGTVQGQAKLGTQKALLPFESQMKEAQATEDVSLRKKPIIQEQQNMNIADKVKEVEAVTQAREDMQPVYVRGSDGESFTQVPRKVARLGNVEALSSEQVKVETDAKKFSDAQYVTFSSTILQKPEDHKTAAFAWANDPSNPAVSESGLKAQADKWMTANASYGTPERKQKAQEELQMAQILANDPRYSNESIAKNPRYAKEREMYEEALKHSLINTKVDAFGKTVYLPSPAYFWLLATQGDIDIAQKTEAKRTNPTSR